jgi:hypothetical protein
MGVFLTVANAEGEYAIKVEFQDKEGRCLATIDGVRLKAADKLKSVSFGVQTFGLLLPAPGTYFVKVYFNDQLAASDIRFEAILTSEASNR